MDEPEAPTGELHFAGVCRFYGGKSARQLAERSGLLHRNGLAFLEYLDDAEGHWTLIVQGDSYRAQVGPFLDVEGELYIEHAGDFDWKPDDVLQTLSGWEADWQRDAQGTSS